MSDTPDSAISLGELVTAAAERASRVTLRELCAASHPIALEPAIVAHLIAHRTELGTWLEATLADRTRATSWERAPAAYLRGLVVRWLQQRNQFVVLDARYVATIESALRLAVRGVARALSSSTEDDALHELVSGELAKLRADLAALVRELLGPEPRDVVSAEYDAELQLAVLGLEASALEDPILDVGCGPGALLVRALDALGHEVRGIDRDAPEEVATVADWLTFPYGTSSWGTVLSHLGFSLHFLHHHHAPGLAARTYAESYMRILRSLRVGGRFAYAPGLPFIESLLPTAEYRVTRVPLAPALRTPAVRAAEAATGLALAHATHITRIR